MTAYQLLPQAYHWVLLWIASLAGFVTTLIDNSVSPLKTFTFILFAYATEDCA